MKYFPKWSGKGKLPKIPNKITELQKLDDSIIKHWFQILERFHQLLTDLMIVYTE